jgi:hypothetical protein
MIIILPKRTKRSFPWFDLQYTIIKERKTRLCEEAVIKHPQSVGEECAQCMKPYLYILPYLSVTDVGPKISVLLVLTLTNHSVICVSWSR